jgi:demethoxyubiquinone hydroxylase (CLK1/Coq7/Cat5 family)
VTAWAVVRVQGKELHNHLQEMLAHFPVRVVLGRTYVRVRHVRASLVLSLFLALALCLCAVAGA